MERRTLWTGDLFMAQNASWCRPTVAAAPQSVWNGRTLHTRSGWCIRDNCQAYHWHRLARSVASWHRCRPLANLVSQVHTSDGLEAASRSHVTSVTLLMSETLPTDTRSGPLICCYDARVYSLANVSRGPTNRRGDCLRWELSLWYFFATWSPIGVSSACKNQPWMQILPPWMWPMSGHDRLQ